MDNIVVMNQSFQVIGILDVYESLLWVEKYNEVSDFEIYLKFTYSALSLLQPDYYVKVETSEKVMIIERIDITEDAELGSYLKVSGRSLESLLDRRIILRQIIVDGTLQAGIQTILEKEIVNGRFPERNYTNFSYTTSTDPIVTALTLDAQYYMHNVYDVIQGLCAQNDIGFRIRLNETNNFVFDLYAGTNRSRDQIINPYVIFSRNFDNLLKSEYFYNKRYLRNFCFISGQDGLESWNQNYYGRWAQVWTNDVGTGINRREMFQTADGLQTFYEESIDEIPDADFVAQLANLGRMELANREAEVNFEGSIDVLGVYKYNEHYFLGDLVELEDSYGNLTKVRVVEMMHSADLSNGYKIYPTLIKV